MQTVLVLGANGRFGRHAVEAFWNAGWRVRTFDRKTDDLMSAAKGADVIVHGWNPAYPDWKRDIPGQTRAIIAAARASGATVLIPANIYVYGSDAPPVLSENTPHRAGNTLGRLRRDMEAAFRASGVQTIVLRAGDYIDTEASGNWFDAVITKRLAKGIITAPGDPDAPHAWAYLPDMAKAAVALAEKRERLARFEDIPFAGHTLSLREIAALASQVTGREMRLKAFPWIALRLAAPLWPMGRHLVEMRYLWTMPHRLDGTKLKALLPGLRETDAASMIASALDLDVDPDKAVARGALHLAAE